MRKIFWKTWTVFYYFFFCSLKHGTKGMRDGEHLVGWRSRLPRICCIGSRGCEAMPLRTRPHLWGQPQEHRSRSWCPHPIMVLPLLHSCLAADFPNQFFNCPLGSWTLVLKVVQGCSGARQWRWGDGHLKSRRNTHPCEVHSSHELWMARTEGGWSGCWVGSGEATLSALWGYLLISAPADDTGTNGPQDNLMGAPNSPFVLVLTHFNFLSSHNYGIECILNSMGPVN